MRAWEQAAKRSLEKDLQEATSTARSLQQQLEDKSSTLGSTATSLQELRQAHAKLQVGFSQYPHYTWLYPG